MGFLVSLTIHYFIPVSLLSSLALCSDILTSNQTLKDGQTLVSSGQIFELGFFSPNNSNKRYLGVWYKNIPLTVVWAANRNKPITNTSAELILASTGSLSLQDNSTTFWLVNATRTANGPSLQLMDTGNLVLKDGNMSLSGEYLWQSFDNISDNLLPGMKLGWDLRTGLERRMTSWSSSNDPSSGEYTFSLEQPETPQLVLRKEDQKQYRWGPWNGVRFSGSNELKANPVFEPRFDSSIEEVYYSFEAVDESLLSRFWVTPDGLIQYLSWRSDNQWNVIATLQRENCDRYGMCGPYGNCYSTDPACKCLKGFTPKSPQDWNSIDWTGGCTRKYELDCGNGDGFVKYENLKLPDNSYLARNGNLSLEECKMQCLQNCSCMAYTMIDIHGNGGDCVVWFDELVDMKNYPDGGDVLYIRMARAELDAIADARRRRRVRLILSVTLTTTFGLLVLGLITWCICGKRKAKRIDESLVSLATMNKNEGDDLELPLFDIATINSATNAFSIENKIGEGGFGVVYQGVLPNGEEIAVKRLSQGSRQGLEEFKNEVVLFSKLQHRNLVKLLGCCTQLDERMLIYEYLGNKSLDYHLFDKRRSIMLSWENRFNIIMGIARGLLYLHEDSRLRIVHRDLKASNILLDNGMNPKISDFGIARIFEGEQTGEMTKRIVGTYGYMSPEYTAKGHFSVKSDVFSFGVLVLEIISGKKNWSFYHPSHDLNLVGHAWRLWSEGRSLELLDEVIQELVPAKAVARCLQIGLLCTQYHVEDRPTMSSVVFMLGNENFEIAKPKEPGSSVTESFFIGTDSSSSGARTIHTRNEITFTAMGGR